MAGSVANVFLKISLLLLLMMDQMLMEFRFLLSSFCHVQCVIPNSHADDLTNGCSVKMVGTLENPASKSHPVYYSFFFYYNQDKYELKVTDYILYGKCDPDSYPLQKKVIILYFYYTSFIVLNSYVQFHIFVLDQIFKVLLIV